jgi:hypothetical protein
MPVVADTVSFFVYPGDVYELDIKEEISKRHPDAVGYRITATDIKFDTDDQNPWRLQAVLRISTKGQRQCKIRYNNSCLPSAYGKALFMPVSCVDALAPTARARLCVTRDNQDKQGKTLYAEIRLSFSVTVPKLETAN